MRILLSGSGGFIGKNLKEYLTGKYQLMTPRSFELNLCDKEAVDAYFKKNKIDFVIHCGTVGGARGIQDMDTTVEDNLAMVDNILSAKNSDTRVILFGSGAMYDKSRPICKISESEIGDIIPRDLYGLSKMMIAQKIKDRDDVLCLNIFACYGYGEKENRFPSYVINQVIKGADIEINQNVIFDYLFVEDMQKIIHHFIKNKPKDNIINITPSESITLEQMAHLVNFFGDKKVQVKLKTNEMNNEYTGNNELLLKNYEGLRFTKYEEGLKKFYDYLKTNMCVV